MLDWILHVFINAILLLVLANILPKVRVRNFGTALVVALIIGILSALTMWLIEGILHVATLGIFYLFGLSFIVRVFAFALIIEITDQISEGFSTEGFWPSLWLAAILALVGAGLDGLLF